MKIVAIANQKGGVAKTTTSVNLTAYLGKLGRQVLLVDLDPQANATSGLGVNKEEVERSVYDVLIGNESLDSIIVRTFHPNVDVAPANLSLVGAEVELVALDRRDLKLKEALKNVSKKQYDYIVIDTPPSLGLLTINALTASQTVLIPMQCEYYALEGLAQLYKTIQLVRRNANPSLAIEGLVFSMVDPRSNLTVQVMAEVKKFLKEKVYDTVIPRNIRLAEAPGFGKSILAYDKNSKGAEAYEKLAKEFLSRSESLSPPAVPPESTAPTIPMGEQRPPVNATQESSNSDKAQEITT